MRKLFEILFRKHNSEHYNNAIEQLKEVKNMLDKNSIKSIKFKEIYITEINFNK